MGLRPPPLPFCEQMMLQNYQSQMLELVEAQTRLAEAQMAVLQMRNTIINSQVTCKDLLSTCYITEMKCI